MSSSWESVCKNARADLPKKDFPSEEELKKLGHCDTEALYYGIAIPPDYIKARHCALSRKDDGVFAGPAILMMLYGNGQGVERNLDLALRFACEIQAAPAETMARIALIQDMKTDSHKKIELCETITSGSMMGFCAQHQERMAQVQKSSRLKVLSEKISEKNRLLFSNLEKASQEFIKTRSTQEIDGSGTAAAAYITEEEGILSEDYIQMLEAYSKGKAHTYTEKDLQEREKKMQELLEKIVSHKKKSESYYGELSPEKIKLTQSAWEKYRDAFGVFAAAEYKGVREYSVKAWLTAKRVHMLKNIAKYLD